MPGESSVICNYNCCEENMSYGTTSMARHLKRKHNLVFKKKDQPRIDYVAHQLMTKLDKCTIDKISQKFAIGLAETSAPYRLLENQSFREGLKCLNPNYSPPSHQKVSRKVNCHFSE